MVGVANEEGGQGSEAKPEEVAHDEGGQPGESKQEEVPKDEDDITDEEARSMQHQLLQMVQQKYPYLGIPVTPLPPLPACSHPVYEVRVSHKQGACLSIVRTWPTLSLVAETQQSLSTLGWVAHAKSIELTWHDGSGQAMETCTMHLPDGTSWQMH